MHCIGCDLLQATGVPATEGQNKPPLIRSSTDEPIGIYLLSIHPT